MTTLIWDADILVYKFALRHQKTYDWGDEPVAHCDLPMAISDTDSYIGYAEGLLGAEDSVIVLSDTKANFRKRILPTYKANRAGAEKPVGFAGMREHLENTYKCFMRPGLEADDVCGIIATSTKIVPGEKIIVSIDKDFNCIPAWRWDGSREDSGHPIIRNPTESEADYWHLYQTIIGDQVDGYTGCPGAGPKAAKALLDDPHLFESYEHEFKSGPRKGKTETRWKQGSACSRWSAIVSLFEKAGLTESDALKQARVARILRASDYNFKTKEPILWQAP